MRAIAATKQHLSGKARVLDFGCGTGSLSLMVAEHVAFVHGVDTSAGMIKVARAEANRREVLNVDFSKSDIFSEEFAGADFDVVVAFNVLHYASDWRTSAPDWRSYWFRMGFSSLQPPVFLRDDRYLERRRSSRRG